MAAGSPRRTPASRCTQRGPASRVPPSLLHLGGPAAVGPRRRQSRCGRGAPRGQARRGERSWPKQPATRSSTGVREHAARVRAARPWAAAWACGVRRGRARGRAASNDADADADAGGRAGPRRTLARTRAGRADGTHRSAALSRLAPTRCAPRPALATDPRGSGVFEIPGARHWYKLAVPL